MVDFYKAIINKINQVSDLNSTLCYTYHSEEEWDDPTYAETICDIFGANKYANGASKIVLFYDDNPDWVIKIPLYGEYYEEEDSYEEFEYARTDWCEDIEEGDYCGREAAIARYAEYYKIEDMFAKTYFVKYISGVPIYISEKIAITAIYADIPKSKNPSSKHFCDELQSTYANELDRIGFSYNMGYLECFIEQYGIDKTNTMINFLEEYEINDIHSNNMGFDSNGKLKLIDYSGFCD